MYLGYQNGKIKFYTEEPLQVDLYNLDRVEETQDEYVLDGEEYILKDDAWEEKQRQKEEERINNLTMTALDFIGVLKQAGLAAVEIEEYLNANIELKQQLTYCQNVYCGVVRQLLPLTVNEIIITDEIVVKAFRIKNGEEV